MPSQCFICYTFSSFRFYAPTLQHTTCGCVSVRCSDDDEYSKWNNFVDSIKSKLTVKQVVDGVRNGGALSFDYLLLIVTAE